MGRTRVTRVERAIRRRYRRPRARSSGCWEWTLDGCNVCGVQNAGEPRLAGLSSRPSIAPFASPVVTSRTQVPACGAQVITSAGGASALARHARDTTRNSTLETRTRPQVFPGTRPKVPTPEKAMRSCSRVKDFSDNCARGPRIDIFGVELRKWRCRRCVISRHHGRGTGMQDRGSVRRLSPDSPREHPARRRTARSRVSPAVGWRYMSRAMLVAMLLGSLAVATASGARSASLSGIHKIKHVIMIMQENRSFDSYFGTFPGADGIPMVNGVPTVCVPDPAAGGCVRPYPDHSDNTSEAAHGWTNSVADIDGGKMDGFIAQAEVRNAACTVCLTGPHAPKDVVGYLTGTDIPNYWSYARNYVLQIGRAHV